jgi:selenocysteine lyase/cysteine desulfurase
MTFFQSEDDRRARFPICRDKIFFAHAGVAPLPRAAADAMIRYVEQSAEWPQEFDAVLREIKAARGVCANLIGAHADEIALLGPTSLGLSLVANGLPWREADEVVCYHGDYPANVYPWMDLARRGVVVRYLEPAEPGEITPELVAAALTPRTRLVALASCHFFSGYRIDVDAIGALLHERGVLFSLDAIQTLGAWPTRVEHVDFLSADAHKWLLGPCAAGIVFVKRAHFETLRPTLLGAWNVMSPHFVAQDEIRFVPSAQRYEPGVLNIAGIYGMKAAIELLVSAGIESIAARIGDLKARLLAQIKPLGFRVIGPRTGANASGITTFRHESASASRVFAGLTKANVHASLRHDREGREFIRFSPHFYNTEDEIDTAVRVMREAL